MSIGASQITDALTVSSAADSYPDSKVPGANMGPIWGQ